MPTILGPSSVGVATLQPLEFGWSPQRGPYTRISHKGPEAAIKAMVPQYIATGYSYVLREVNGGIWVIEGEAAIDGSGYGVPAAGVESTEVWSLQINKVSKDFLSSNCAAVAALSAEDIRKIRDALNTPADGALPALSEGAAAIYKLGKAGVDQWNINQPILKRTVSVPRNWNVAMNIANIGKVLTTAQLYSLEGLPSDFFVDLASIATQLAHQTRTDGIAKTTGWLKSCPTMEVTSQGRRDASIDYEFGLWATLLYASA